MVGDKIELEFNRQPRTVGVQLHLAEQRSKLALPKMAYL